MDWKQVGSGVIFAFGMLCIGFTGGGVVGGRVLSSGGMGWDRLADTLGGVMVGMVAAAILTGAVVAKLSHRQRITTAAVCIGLSVLLIVVMQQTRGPSP